MVRSPLDYDAFHRVAVEVFNRQNLEAIGSLKKFLTALPSFSHIGAALLQAIYQLAEQQPETCRWILQHREYLEPELNLQEVVQHRVVEQLHSEGLLINQDFSFTVTGELTASESIQIRLWQQSSVADRLLFEEVLAIHPFP